MIFDSKRPSVLATGGVVLLYGVGSAIGAGLATLTRRDAASRVAPGDAATRSPAPQDSLVHAPPDKAKTAGAAHDDASAYSARRDDGNATLRLQSINRWARDAGPDRNLDFLTRATVDPDESVRARAQELFDREVIRTRRTTAGDRSNASPLVSLSLLTRAV